MVSGIQFPLEAEHEALHAAVVHRVRPCVELRAALARGNVIRQAALQRDPLQAQVEGEEKRKMLLQAEMQRPLRAVEPLLLPARCNRAEATARCRRRPPLAHKNKQRREAGAAEQRYAGLRQDVACHAVPCCALLCTAPAALGRTTAPACLPLYRENPSAELDAGAVHILVRRLQRVIVPA